MIKQSIKILKGLKHPTGLFSASSIHVKTGYNLSWIRDNIYESLGFEAVNDFNEVRATYRALLDLLFKHEYKIDWAIKEKPKFAYQYIHARYDPITMEEVWDNWGNKQNDAVGALLFKIGELEEKGVKIIRDENDLRILQKLVYYLESIQYWQDRDNGIWEEKEELHASSIGACAAGLNKISKLVEVPEEIISKGEDALSRLLPRESESKDVDMALLSLIYPYNVVSREIALSILENVEKDLVREKGVIRYKGDNYYNNNGEAEWTQGLSWLAIIYNQLGMTDKYTYYMKKAFNAVNEKGELPELYFANSDMHNENSPLGWSQALFLVMQTV
ncbi:MAG TPA: glycoside hydrolase family 15 protein [Candidatus Nanoarchaeia archaeon]|nr:glycoside hydrolase family 15 protein [Candidatus Nanoarchaeia archaeon]